MANNRNSIVGITKKMNCGMNATCIAYRMHDDIDVQFEDGTIVEHKTKCNFLRGQIQNPNINKASIVGISVKQNCGMNAKCIAYRKYNDIDIQFEDGTIVLNKSKSRFISGEIQNPNLKRKTSNEYPRKCFKEENCLNISRQMSNGQNATCIAYRGSADIDVQFEDGTIVEHARKASFFKGWIQNPNYNSQTKASCVGQSVLQNCGMNATCIVYRNNKDIDVEFEDGTIVEHRTKLFFLKGKIGYPNSCLNETRTMNNGLKATCIAYRGWHDIDVKLEDGTIIQHRSQTDFKRGNIGHPDYSIKSMPQELLYFAFKELGFNVILNYRPKWLKNESTGKYLEIDLWLEDYNIGIEYDGYPWHAKKTELSDLKFQMINSTNKVNKMFNFIEKGCTEYESDKYFNYRMTFNTYKQNSINYDEIVLYVNDVCNKITGKKYNFKITDSFINSIQNNVYSKIIGQRVMMNCGMEATCIAYRGAGDIDIQFEDGTIVQHKAYYHFINGAIANPTYNSQYDRMKDKASCLGETRLMNCGMKAKCIAYRGTRDIDVQFEDGTIVKNKQKNAFMNGIINNPNYDRFSCLNEEVIQNCGMKAKCIAYRGRHDIDVQFEDGTIIEHRSKGSFIKGEISHPTYNPGNERIKAKASCLGETRLMNCGMNATCIAYRGSKDIDVQFEDGTIVEHREKRSFINGEIANRVIKKE